MITQALLDFLRDVVVNWITGTDSLMQGVDAGAAGAALGGVAALGGHVLALFVANSVWPAILSTWAVWLSVWLATGLIAIFSRRTKAE